jgi:hypothetical protein
VYCELEKKGWKSPGSVPGQGADIRDELKKVNRTARQDIGVSGRDSPWGSS